jgi:O-antigen/teichoic acid export membrane protein
MAAVSIAAPSSRRVVAGASAALAVRVLGAVLMLGFQVLVARRLGASEAGRFYLVFAVVAVASTLGRYGTDQIVVRLVALGDGDAGALRSTYRAATVLSVALCSAAAAAVVALAGWGAGHAFGDPALAGPLRLGGLCAVPLGLVTVQGEAIKGLGRIVPGAAVQSLVAPVASIAVLLLVPAADDASAVVLVYGAGLVLSVLAASATWRWGTAGTPAAGAPPRGHRPLRPELAGLARSCRPFFAASAYGLVLSWAGVIALGAMGTSADVAGYFAADRYTNAASMALVALNSAVGPHFARLWAVGDRAAVRRLLVGTTRASAAAGLLFLAGALAVSGPLLSVFGSGFASSVGPFRILALGQFVVLAGGPVTSLLVMSGREAAQARAGAVASAIAVALLLVLVPPFGLYGAATALTVAVTANKLLIALALRRALVED